MRNLRLAHLGIEDDRTPSQRMAAKETVICAVQTGLRELREWDQTQSRFVVNPEATQRMLAAGEMFRQLIPAQRTLLRQAASRSPKLYRALFVGDWTAALRALRGLGLRVNEPSYLEFATLFAVQVANGLEGEVHLPRSLQLEATKVA